MPEKLSHTEMVKHDSHSSLSNFKATAVPRCQCHICLPGNSIKEATKGGGAKSNKIVKEVVFARWQHLSDLPSLLCPRGFRSTSRLPFLPLSLWRQHSDWWPQVLPHFVIYCVLSQLSHLLSSKTVFIKMQKPRLKWFIYISISKCKYYWSG